MGVPVVFGGGVLDKNPGTGWTPPGQRLGTTEDQIASAPSGQTRKYMNQCSSTSKWINSGADKF